MFKNAPEVISHKVAVRDDNNFITEKYIVTSNKGTITVLNRLCPHRLYPIGEIGPSKNIVCKFHGFEFNKDGSPVNNTRHMNCYDVKIDDTGLITKNFHMPKNKQWVKNLENEKNQNVILLCHSVGFAFSIFQFYLEFPEQNKKIQQNIQKEKSKIMFCVRYCEL